MNTHGTAADFRAIQHHVIGFGECLARFGFQQILMAVGRGSEWMVQRLPAVLLLIPFEHRKIHYPQRLPARFGESPVMSNLGAQRTQCFIHYFGLVCAEEYEIAIFGIGTFQDNFYHRFRQEF